MSATRLRVDQLLDEGLTGGEIARRLGISAATVSYHRRRLGRPGDGAAARRYDWADVQAHYDAGHSVRECQVRFGFSRQTWHAAVARGPSSRDPPRWRWICCSWPALRDRAGM